MLNLPVVPMLVVPMDPQYLPELGLLIGGLFAAGAAVHFLLVHQKSQAIRAGAATLGCIALALVLAKTAHTTPDPTGLRPAGGNSMSLVLGEVVLRVAPSDRYTLSVDDRSFLEIDLRRSELAVTGVVGAHDKVVARIERNTFPARWADVRPTSPDAHTLLIHEAGEDIFRLHFSEPRRIEVASQFFGATAAAPLISCREGISWQGGAVRPGTVIDLR